MLGEVIGGFVDGGVVECWSSCQVVKLSKSQRVKDRCLILERNDDT